MGDLLDAVDAEIEPSAGTAATAHRLLLWR
jgi:hypothetical protein